MRLHINYQVGFAKILVKLVLAFFVINSGILIAQDPPINLGNVYPNVIPPSPTVSGLGQYLDHPVDFYTGLPKISIPIYEITTQNISLPITLSYHASGITVDKLSSWVGLGWSLHAGGFISRTVRGLPDDLYLAPNIGHFNACDLYGIYYHYPRAGYLDCALIHINDFQYPLYIAKGLLDGIPDIFQYQFGNYSGEFLFDENGTIRLVPENDLKITFSRNTQNGEISEFIVLTPDGNKYIFNIPEKTTIASKGWHDEEIGASTQFLSVTVDPLAIGIPPEGNSDQHAPFISTWHLNKIALPGATEEISFSYREEEQLIRSNNEDRDQKPNYLLPYKIRTATATYIKAKLLSEITWTGGHVIFSPYIYSRMDVEHDGNYALDAIGIYNEKNQLIKGVKFDHSYFQSTPPQWGSGGADVAARFSKRLRLDSIVEYHSNAGNIILSPPYIFSYNTIALPHRASAEKDFWGFYNHSNETSLIPLMYEYRDEIINDSSFYTSKFSFYPRSSYVGGTLVHPGANRNVDTLYCKASILEQITFPTGGAIRYVYEPHEFFVMGQSLMGGGLRLKEQILSPDNSFNTGNIIKIYDYCDSGKILDLPQFSCRTWSGEVVVTRSLWDSKNGISKGGYVTYSQVKEKTVGNGYTDYQYLQPATFGVFHDDYSQINNEFIYVRSIIDNYIVAFDDYDSFFNPYNPNYDWKRGLINCKTVFNQEGDTLSKTNFEYTIKRYKKIPQFESVIVYSVVMTFPNGGMECPEECKKCYGYSISPWIELTSTQEKTYDGNTVIEKTVNNEFASITHHQITSKTETNSEGKVFSERYKYIADIDFSQMTLNCKTTYLNCKADAKAERDLCLSGCETLPDPELRECTSNCNEQYKSDTATCLSAYNLCLDGINLPEKTQVVFNMQNEHIIALPLETQKLADNKAVGGEVFEYNTFVGTSGNIYKPKVELSLLTDNPIANCQQVHLDNQNNLVYDSRYAPIYNYDKYSTKGNPTELFKENDIHTVYLWGYNDTYPVVKAENTSYSDLNNAVNAATDNLENLLNDTIGDMTTVAQKSAWTKFNTALISYPGLSNALVTTYTYKPLVGVTSITDPNGILAYFEYDAFGRLIIVRDNGNLGGNIVKKYDYHYTTPSPSK